MEFTCENIGMDQAELQERVVQGLVDKILGGRTEDGILRTVMDEAYERIESSIHAVVGKIAEEHIYPMAEKLISEHIFQRTTKWGEKKGEPMSFVEYLDKCTMEYFEEEVNDRGQSRHQCPGHTRFSSAGTRLAHMVGSTLNKEMRQAATKVGEGVHTTLAEAMADAATTTLEKLSKKMKIEVDL